MHRALSEQVLLKYGEAGAARHTIILPSSLSGTEPSCAFMSGIGWSDAVALVVGDCGTEGKRADKGVIDLVRCTRFIASVPAALSSAGCLSDARLRGECRGEGGCLVGIVGLSDVAGSVRRGALQPSGGSPGGPVDGPAPLWRPQPVCSPMGVRKGFTTGWGAVAGWGTARVAARSPAAYAASSSAA